MLLLWFLFIHIGHVGLCFLKIPYCGFNKFGAKVEVNACVQPAIFKQKSYDSENNQGKHYHPHFINEKQNSNDLSGLHSI